MMHKRRVWSLYDTHYTFDNIDGLVDKLHGHSWTVCTGFRLNLADGGALLFVSDATGGDGAQEYGVVLLSAERIAKLDRSLKDDGYALDVQGVQIESLTISWMEYDAIQDAIVRLVKLAAGGTVETPPTTDGPVVVATSVASLVAALGGDASQQAVLPMQATVTINIEAGKRHRERSAMCCA